MERRCAVCFLAFKPLMAKQILCGSADCRKERAAFRQSRRVMYHRRYYARNRQRLNEEKRRRYAEDIEGARERNRLAYKPVERIEKRCEECGGVFKAVRSDQLVCGRECRLMRLRRQGAFRYLETKRAVLARRVARYREREERAAALAAYRLGREAWRECVSCGATFRPVGKRKTCGALSCRSAHQREAGASALGLPRRVCIGCGEIFVPAQLRQEYCFSGDCRDEKAREVRRERKRRYDARYPEKVREARRRRREKYPEKRALEKRVYQIRHHERLRERYREYNQAHRDGRNNASARLRAANIEWVRLYSDAYRALVKSAADFFRLNDLPLLRDGEGGISGQTARAKKAAYRILRGQGILPSPREFIIDQLERSEQ